MDNDCTVDGFCPVGGDFLFANEGHDGSRVWCPSCRELVLPSQTPPRPWPPHRGRVRPSSKWPVTHARKGDLREKHLPGRIRCYYHTLCGKRSPNHVCAAAGVGVTCKACRAAPGFHPDYVNED